MTAPAKAKGKRVTDPVVARLRAVREAAERLQRAMVAEEKAVERRFKTQALLAHAVEQAQSNAERAFLRAIAGLLPETGGEG